MTAVQEVLKYGLIFQKMRQYKVLQVLEIKNNSNTTVSNKQIDVHK